MLSATTSGAASLDSRPREELPYAAVHPALDVRAPLPLVAADAEFALDDLAGAGALAAATSSSTSAAPPAALPVASFAELAPEDAAAQAQAQVQAPGPARRAFALPEQHLLYEDASEQLLATTVEYDMDEQDKCWLDAINEARRGYGLVDVPEDFFEVAIDKLEKEWFELHKDIPKAGDFFPEEVSCAICDDGECENSNAIVLCDGCNIAVHQECYGIPFVPEGQWLCRKCMLSPGAPVQCAFCPHTDGAFKQTTNNQWAHLLCALWIPEVTISNAIYMEPIDSVDQIPRSRWKLKCYLCRKLGACIQCDNKTCYIAMHVTCARKAKLYLKMKSGSTLHMKCYCDKHAPKEHRERVDIPQAMADFAEYIKTHKLARMRRYIPEESSGGGANGAASSTDDEMETSSADNYDEISYAKNSTIDLDRLQYLVPNYILNQLIEATKKYLTVAKKSEVLAKICKYWALKRDARKGAPLLKRLHLEPWTASTSEFVEDEKNMAARFEALQYLRTNFESARTLLDQVKKREKAKLRVAELQKMYVEIYLQPVTFVMRTVLADLDKSDNKNIFAEPVSPIEVPDYYDIIQKPMDLRRVREKLDNYEYDDIDDFGNDVKLIFGNALIYNKPDTVFAKEAMRLQRKAEAMIDLAAQKLGAFAFHGTMADAGTELHPLLFTFGVPADQQQRFSHDLLPPAPERQQVSFQSLLGGSDTAAAASAANQKKSGGSGKRRKSASSGLSLHKKKRSDAAPAIGHPPATRLKRHTTRPGM